jgi:SAM-dependent methyltransferase
MMNSWLVGNGKCTICGNYASFVIEEGYSLREARCKFCQGTRRNRDLARILLTTFFNDKFPSLSEGLNALRTLSIYEAQTTGPIHSCLQNLPDYFCSEFFYSMPSGMINEAGIRCENLESLSFPADRFDLVITQDVLEHVRNLENALKEIRRVLKPGGYHIFTVPVHEGRKTSRRIEIHDGRDVAVLPAVYHGDPLRHAGSLVYTDFGGDIADYLNALDIPTEIALNETFYTEEVIPWIHDEVSYRHYLDHTVRGDILKFFLYNSIVLKSRKPLSQRDLRKEG